VECAFIAMIFIFVIIVVIIFSFSFGVISSAEILFLVGLVNLFVGWLAGYG